MNLCTKVLSIKRDATRCLKYIRRRQGGKYSIAIRAISTQDFMTADIINLKHEDLEELAEDILNINSNISEVLYDVTTKPPATIEFE